MGNADVDKVVPAVYNAVHTGKITTTQGLEILKDFARSKRPMSDLLYVERVVNAVCQSLASQADEADDVEVAARYKLVCREFPFAFLRWAAALGNNEAGDVIPETPLRKTCAEIPLFVNIDKSAGSRPQLHPLPTICIEGLIYFNAAKPPESESIWLRRQRTIEELMQKYNKIWEQASKPLLPGALGTITGTGGALGTIPGTIDNTFGTWLNSSSRQFQQAAQNAAQSGNWEMKELFSNIGIGGSKKVKKG